MRIEDEEVEGSQFCQSKPHTIIVKAKQEHWMGAAILFIIWHNSPSEMGALM